MDDKSFNIRVPKKWVRVAMIVGVTALIVAPLTAIASHSFTDVPDSNTFHGDIAAIADAGVTKGCNPPDNTEYCPDDFVTRGQMAAFMNRLGALGPGKTPVVNADTLDGLDSTQLASRAAFASSDDLPNENTTLDADIVAPATGILVMNAAVRVVYAGPDGGHDDVLCRLLVDGVAVAGTNMLVGVSDPPDEPLNNPCNTTGGFVVDAGAHTVTFDITGVNDAGLSAASLNVVWVPFDGTGAVPTAVAAQAGTGDGDGDGR